MDYRDWGYGDRAPYERRSSTPWVDETDARAASDRPASSSPWEAYLGASWGESTEPGRSSDEVDSIIAEVDDAYWTPPSSTALPLPRQGGRHRDDREDDALAPSPVSSPRARFSGSAVVPTSGSAASSALNSPTESFSRTPLTDGSGLYTGSNFGRPADDDPVLDEPLSAGPVSSDPIPTRPVSSDPIPTRPVSSDPIPTRPVSSRPTSGGWRPRNYDADWSRRPVDNGDWRDIPETDEWRRSDDTGEWLRSGHTSEWRNSPARSWSEPADQDEPPPIPRPRDWRDDTSVGEWRRGAYTGQFERVTDDGWGDERPSWSATGGSTTYPESDPGRWNDAPSYGRQRRAVVETETSWRDSGETFWSGTRLAEDDPRWVETPSSAPRSPAVAYPRPPRPPAAPAPSRFPYRPSVRPRRDRLDEELLSYDPGGYLASLIYTALWFAVPVLLFTFWIFTLDNTPPPPGCVTDVTGGGCQSDRAAAISSLIGGTPQFGAAFLASLAVAVVLRRASGSWRAASVGLASAVVGGGLTTVIFTALNS